MGCPRSITFTVPGTSASGAVQITAVENNGHIDFTAKIVGVAPSTSSEIRGIFFDINNFAARKAGIAIGGGDPHLKVVDFENAIDLGNGVNLKNVAQPFDVGLKFGSAGSSKDLVKEVHFTLDNTAHNLTLDDLAHVDFGVVLPGADGKFKITSPAAPDAVNDVVNMFEDGASGLNQPLDTPQGVKMQVLANDTDADAGTKLTITHVEGALHGTLAIVDGNDADLLPGDAVLYTPVADYAGTDSFEYCISDNAGGTDSARVDVNIAAVADKATVQIEVLDPDNEAVNTVHLRVTATETDADHSEFVDSLVIGDLPAGVTVDVSSSNPAGQPGSITQEFTITLPDAIGSDYTKLVNAIFTATTQEKSNADTEAHAGTQQIELSNDNQQASPTFEAEDQDLWGGAGSHHAAGDFFGLEPGPNLDTYDPVPLTFPLRMQFQATVKAGFEPVIDFEGGNVDAELTYDITVDKTMNATTDTLRISTAAELTGGSFTTSGAGGDMGIDLVFGYNYHFGVSLDLVVPGLNWSLIDQEFKDQANIEWLSVDDGDPMKVIDNLDGTGGSAIFPHLDVSGSWDANTGKVSGSATFAEFFEAHTDLDAFLNPLPLGGLGLFDIPVAFGIEGVGWVAGVVELFDFDLGTSLDLEQDMEMSAAPELPGIIVFENGDTANFKFGEELTFQDAVASYDDVAKGGNGNGVVEFEIQIDAEAMFSNTTSLVHNTSVDFDILGSEGQYDTIFEDGAPTWNYDGISIVDETSSSSSNIYSGDFALNFGTYTMMDFAA